MKEKLIALLCILISYNINAQNKSYFVSNTGNDNNDGLTINTPWKTIQKINASTFYPGDVIHFKSGDTFSGMLMIDAKQSGISGNPVVYKSYGQDRAIIDGAAADGIWIFNAEFIEVRDLIIKGNGVSNNNGAGIYASTDRNDKMLDGVVIDNVDVSGFYWMGIGVATENSATKGFINLRITNATVYNNGFSGIETSGSWDEATGMSAFNHKGMYIGYSKVYQNHGISTYTNNWSGTGILMAGVENGLIEYCEAFENGGSNGCTTGGPVGIWLANAKNCIIQYCESYNNKAGKSKDGGGFDIDGGSQNCIIQYNYSHNNEGPGYALFEWGNNIPFTGNIIRYNISQNDARRNSYGAITFWGVDGSHKILNSEVYNNSIYVSKEGLLSGTPSAVKLMGTNMKGLKIRNNIFYVTQGINMLYSSSTFDTSIIHFQNNNYYDTTGRPNFFYRYNYTSLSDWKNAAVGQEKRGSQSLGFSKDPRFINPGGGKPVKPTEGGDFSYMTAYMIQPGSDMIDNALDLNKEFSIDMGVQDFYKTPLRNASKFDIGANEFSSDKFMVMPLSFTSFQATHQSAVLNVKWVVESDIDISLFELQVSNDGAHFTTLKLYQYYGKQGRIILSDKINYAFEGKIYCRIKAISKTNMVSYSPVASLKNSKKETALSAYPNPVKGNVNISFQASEFDKLLVKNIQGLSVIEKEINAGAASINVNCSKLQSGFYIVELINTATNNRKHVSFIKK